MSRTASTQQWNQQAAYHAHREPYAEGHVRSLIYPFIEQHRQRFEGPLAIADFACGSGAIAAELIKACQAHGVPIQRFLLIDVVADNLDVARQRLQEAVAGSSIRVDSFLANGSDFSDYSGEKVDLLYCWDAMVHFDIHDVAGYLASLQRVLDGYGFFHHSNLQQLTTDINKNPHCRNFMTKDVFAQLAISAGLFIEQQRTVDWELKDLDCLTYLSTRES